MRAKMLTKESILSIIIVPVVIYLFLMVMSQSVSGKVMELVLFDEFFIPSPPGLVPIKQTGQPVYGEMNPDASFLKVYYSGGHPFALYNL